MTFEKDAVVLEKNVRAERLVIASLIALAAFGALVMYAGGNPNVFALLLVPGGLWTRISTENWRARRRAARVRASAEGVFVDGVLAVPPGRIGHGLVQPRTGKKPTVRLRGSKQSVLFEIEVEDAAEGAAFLRAIGHDAAARKATFRTMSPFFSTRGRSFLTLLGFFCVAPAIIVATFSVLGFGAAPSAIAALLGFVPLALSIRARMVDVGADGLSFTWNRQRRYVSFDDVESVQASEVDAIELVLRSGKKIPLRTGGNAGWDAGERAALLRDALLRRILEAMDAHRAHVGPRDLAAQLARGERDPDAWLADLRKLRAGEGNYRSASVRDDDLWRVVEDPGAPEEARAAAAVLLRNTEDAKPRLRIAADAVASPRLRVALEAEEEAEAEQALRAYLR